MKFERKLSKANTPVEQQVKWKTVEANIPGAGFSMSSVEVPAHWTETPTNILAQKYLRKAGVPLEVKFRNVDATVPVWLQPCVPAYEDTKVLGETSAKQVFHRLAGAWTYQGWKMGLFGKTVGLTDAERRLVERNAQVFYDELYLILAQQLAAPNSPQWFNTGLWWAYGIEGPANGQWAINYDPMEGIVGNAFQTKNSYEYPQPHACFIQPVADDLVNPGGIMDLWTREARLFKYGSGTGSNFSNLRGENETLSGGGKSSGLMSFLEIGDRAAGAIKSGGTTRRAAKMVVVDADHPDIEKFIDWKAREEQKAAAMWAGSRMMTDPAHREYMLKWGLIPQAMLDRMSTGFEFEEFSIDYEGEAIRSVGGQNANNTVRVTDDFMEDVENNKGWSLISRTEDVDVKTIPARSLWTKILRAAWASADPGLQFHDTIHKWHTCKADGEIKASNPCSEYMFLDNTACNLASLNLVKFYELTNLADPTSHKFDVDLFTHVARLMTVVLDISVTMASFPSKEIALGSYNYRTLGLGYANLGGLLMRMGWPYDSNEGRTIAASITSIMTGIAYQTSAGLATELGPFPRYENNKQDVIDVLQLHHDATMKLPEEGLSQVAKNVWLTLPTGGHGFRNAQVTLLAPTGTIGLLMDCETLGIEPDFALVKHKALAGGGDMVLVNEAVDQALTKLGYKTHTRNLIRAYVKENGTVEFCSDLLPEHAAIFDCAVAPQGYSRSIRPMAHVEMVAAVQPFLSGAVSKTINMPNSATIDDVGEVYMQAWKLGLKAVALYRDGSKLAQPLATKTKEQTQNIKLEYFLAKGLIFEAPGRLVPTNVVREIETGEYIADLTELYKHPVIYKEPAALARGEREYLPWRRDSAYVQKVIIGDQSLHMTVGKYPDGRAGEIFLELSRAGTTLHAMTNLVAMMISIGLQYGVPVEEYVRRLADRKFEPSGLVEGHDNIKWVSSIADFIARELGISFLKAEEMGQVPREPKEDHQRESVGAMAVPTTHRTLRDICPACHEPALVRSGTCQTCQNCGYNDGCGG